MARSGRRVRPGPLGGTTLTNTWRRSEPRLTPGASPGNTITHPVSLVAHLLLTRRPGRAYARPSDPRSRRHELRRRTPRRAAHASPRSARRGVAAPARCARARGQRCAQRAARGRARGPQRQQQLRGPHGDLERAVPGRGDHLDDRAADAMKERLDWRSVLPPHATLWLRTTPAPSPYSPPTLTGVIRAGHGETVSEVLRQTG